jgi:cbb3-type cytochrome oxidase subunit 1
MSDTKGWDVYRQTFIDTCSRVSFCKLVTIKTPFMAADALDDKVLHFLNKHMLPTLHILTNQVSEYGGHGQPMKQLWGKEAKANW